MKLLFDQNLSRFLVARLADVFPDSTHVVLTDLEAAPDSVIWTFAAEHGFVLPTIDRGFLGFTPGLVSTSSLVLLTLGNCSTDKVEEMLRVDRKLQRPRASLAHPSLKAGDCIGCPL